MFSLAQLASASASAAAKTTRIIASNPSTSLPSQPQTTQLHRANGTISAMSSSFKPSSGSGGAGRVIHQDFIARIRHSNALPPPAIPPKLLDIPNTGLASGQYTTPGFASRLAREQPLNIEADAELGMPLDLVGMPGIFDGDESCTLHPRPLPFQPPFASPLTPSSNSGTQRASRASPRR